MRRGGPQWKRRARAQKQDGSAAFARTPHGIHTKGKFPRSKGEAARARTSRPRPGRPPGRSQDRPSPRPTSPPVPPRPPATPPPPPAAPVLAGAPAGAAAASGAGGASARRSGPSSPVQRHTRTLAIKVRTDAQRMDACAAPLCGRGVQRTPRERCEPTRTFSAWTRATAHRNYRDDWPCPLHIHVISLVGAPQSAAAGVIKVPVRDTVCACARLGWKNGNTLWRGAHLLVRLYGLQQARAVGCHPVFGGPGPSVLHQGAVGGRASLAVREVLEQLVLPPSAGPGVQVQRSLSEFRRVYENRGQ